MLSFRPKSIGVFMSITVALYRTSRQFNLTRVALVPLMPVAITDKVPSNRTAPAASSEIGYFVLKNRVLDAVFV
jgi:hypothetical protein